METGENLMALVRVKQNFQITLPVEVRNALGIAQGDFLEATVCVSISVEKYPPNSVE